eukprot:SAG11_NODE_724_length_7524_cov_6.241481_4_plen_48_part_00
MSPTAPMMVFMTPEVESPMTLAARGENNTEDSHRSSYVLGQYIIAPS